MTSKGKVRQIIDEAALSEYLKNNVQEIALPVKVEQFKHGQSNPTYLLTDSQNTKYVLRKQPPGELISKTAHAVDREYRVIKAVGGSTGVPAPKVYCFCTDKSIVGSPFYIMQFLDGRIFVDASLPEISTKEERTAMWKSVIDALAKLHSLDPKDVGLEDYGPTSDFYPRQARSLAKVSRAQAIIKSKDGSRTVGEIPHIEELTAFFATDCPVGETTIMHGDYKMDNVVFHKTKPEVIGLLDWELSTLGHPFADLGNLFMPFFWPGGTEQSDLRGFSDKQLKSLPSMEELLQYYCKKSGREYPLPRWQACQAFSFFRLSVISQGIAARSLLGIASSEQAEHYGALFPGMAELAFQAMKEAKRFK